MQKPEIETAWLFPGQGSQEVGMGDRYLPPTHVPRGFEIAEHYSGLPLRSVCPRGPEATLVQTDYLQPMLVALSVAFVDYFVSIE